MLVCDTGGPTGGLAAYARVSAPRSLPRAANAIAASAALSEGLFAVAESQLRVVASGPDLDEEVDERGLDRLLADAREAHRLTVVDCGTLGGAVAARVLAAATHLIWVIPATRSGIRRARPVLELLGIEPERRELVVARRDASGRRSPVEDLATLAEARAAPLVLMPHVSDLGERDAEDGLEAGAVALDAIRSVVSRSGS